MVFEYAPAPESTKIVNLKSNYDLFIGGKFVKTKSGSTYKTINPATEEVLAEIIEASQKDVDEAVKSARKAFKTWSKLSLRRKKRTTNRHRRFLPRSTLPSPFARNTQKLSFRIGRNKRTCLPNRTFRMVSISSPNLLFSDAM